MGRRGFFRQPPVLMSISLVKISRCGRVTPTLIPHLEKQGTLFCLGPTFELSPAWEAKQQLRYFYATYVYTARIAIGVIWPPKLQTIP